MARFHLDTLGRRGIFYHDQPSCERALLEFDRLAAQAHDWNAYRAFEPEPVMLAFRKVFLGDLPGEAATSADAGLREDAPACEAGSLDEAQRRHGQLLARGARIPCCTGSRLEPAFECLAQPI